MRAQTIAYRENHYTLTAIRKARNVQRKAFT